MDTDPPRSINALNLPASYNEFPRFPLSSDKFAWGEVRGRSYCDWAEQYPVSDMRWGLACTGSSHHYWHLDANGLATFVRVETGIKFWYIAIPKSGEFSEFGDFEIFENDFDLSSVNSDRWDIEIIVFGPGSTLIMRPNLPHAVVSPEPRLYYQFVGDKTLTNTSHEDASYSLLTRLLVLFVRDLTEPRPDELECDDSHIPDVETWSGLMNMLTFCNYFELHVVTINWKFVDKRSFELRPSGDVISGMDALTTVYSEYLAHQARTLLVVERSARRQGLESTWDHLSSDAVRDAVFNCIKGGPAWAAFMRLGDDFDKISFFWSGPEYKVICNMNNQFDFPYIDGLVYGDLKTAQKFRVSLGEISDRALVEREEEGTGTDQLEEEDENDHMDVDSQNDSDYEEHASPRKRNSEKIDEIYKLITTASPLSSSASPRTNKSRIDVLKENRRKIKEILTHLNETIDRPKQDQNSAEYRFNRIMETVNTEELIVKSPKDFVQLMLEDQHKGRLALQEDRGFLRLFWSYSGDSTTWEKALKSLRPEEQSWERICTASTHNDNTNTGSDRLLHTQQVLASLSTSQSGNNFVGYVLRTIQTLKFSIQWSDLNQQPRGKTIKSQYIIGAFNLEHQELYEKVSELYSKNKQNNHEYKTLKKEYDRKLEKFRKDHARIIYIRKAILTLYQTFGPIILLDPAWDTLNGSEPKNHTLEFTEIINLLCENCPVYTGALDDPVFDDESLLIPVMTFETCFTSLFHILVNLSSTPIAKYVCQFIATNPPTEVARLDINWLDGLNEFITNVE
ncbi:hypothetical protein C0993_002815 [Termitomyces sp. T159_Od127]|nr:hypothetical protein C0993_002815 [Termitomyces sp. T159_Od127]